MTTSIRKATRRKAPAAKPAVDMQSPSPEIQQAARTPYFRWKAALDRTFAAIALVPGIPMIGLLVILVRLTSPGPGIYRQQRVGKDGRPFVMYKLRSMRQNAESHTGPVWTQVNDMRVTRVGKVLRKLHLDELPQLFNVLKGEMSLIGPRPERPEFVAVLAEAISGYDDRLAVLPGITGLAQINLPPDTDLESVRRKQVLDLEYIGTAGLLLDLRILLCTTLRIVGVHGELAMRLMRLKRTILLPDDEPRIDVVQPVQPTPEKVASHSDNGKVLYLDNGKSVG